MTTGVRATRGAGYAPPPRASGSDPDAPATRPSVQWWADRRVLLLAVVTISALYVGWHLGRGWVAHDEGMLGQSAERVLQGELPHRDFDEMYTGALTVVNAVALRLLGTTLMSMRIVLFGVFLLWVPAVYYVASRFVRPLAAAAVTLLCVAWSVPNYPAAVPSWYALFLTVFGVAALCRWLDDRRAGWLVAAGVAAGLSVIVKVIGLYFVGSVLLFMAFQAHENSLDAGAGERRQGWAYGAFITLCLLAIPGALALIVRREPHPAEVVHFVLPAALVAGLQIWREWTHPAGRSRDRFLALSRLVLPFVAGVALPVLVFVVPYARTAALGPLFDGVFVLPLRRFAHSSYRMLSLWSLIALAPIAGLVAYGRLARSRMTRYHVFALLVALGAWLYGTGTVPLLYRLVWYGARGALPVLVLLGVVALRRATADDAESRLRRSRTMLVLSTAAIFTVVQFPFSVPIYFCYVAPLVILLAAAVLGYAPPMAPAVPRALTIFFLAFAVLRMNTSELFGMGVLYRPYPLTASLGLPRGDLEIPVHEVEMYRVAVTTLQAHARGGYTWASPDCPELYFLAGLRNPTRSFFDYFDDGAGRTPRILAALDRHAVTAVVINRGPQFSPVVAADLTAEIARRYPNAADVGKFQVRWR
jgi:hypothetical protein